MNRKRTAWVNRLEQSGKDYLGYLSQLTEEQIHDVPAPGEWSIHQVIAHVRDTERYVFLERVQRILTETHPAVENFDQDAWNKDHYDPNEPLKRIVADFRSLRRKLISLLRKSKDKDWENWAMHSEYHKITIDWLVMHDYHHTLEHTVQMGYLNEKVLLKYLNG